MGFSNRINKIATSTSNTDLEYEKKAGVYLCTVKSVSESPEGHMGSPYLLFKMRNEKDRAISAKLWVANESDDIEKANRKDNKIKQVFENFGIDIVGKNGADLMSEVIGKQAMFAFQEREYIGKDPGTFKPEIKTALNYFYSAKVDGKINPLNEGNCTQKLSEGDYRKFEQQVMQWEQQNPQMASNTQEKSNEDLAF
tara:strand:+ start:3007 stop:3597 length:591 start_codon:yes stop_codon:yes gene_type:complete